MISLITSTALPHQRGAVDHGDQLISIMVPAFDLAVLVGSPASQCFLYNLKARLVALTGKVGKRLTGDNLETANLLQRWGISGKIRDPEPFRFHRSGNISGSDCIRPIPSVEDPFFLFF